MTVSRKDLEGKLREIQSVFDETKASARDASVVVAVAIVALVAVAFLVGRRRGKKGSGARIEIRQVR